MLDFRINEYDRDAALEYAHKWAYDRNPGYYDFSHIGGDCTNFASQVLYAGSGVMNFTPVYGWYYISLNNRTPSWTGVEFLFNYLIREKGAGPAARQVPVNQIIPGDLIQLSFNEEMIFGHTLVVVKAGTPADYSNILIATHTYDRDYYPLANYYWRHIRFMHIYGVIVQRF